MSDKVTIIEPGLVATSYDVMDGKVLRYSVDIEYRHDMAVHDWAELRIASDLRIEFGTILRKYQTKSGACAAVSNIPGVSYDADDDIIRIDLGTFSLRPTVRGAVDKKAISLGGAFDIIRMSVAEGDMTLDRGIALVVAKFKISESEARRALES